METYRIFTVKDWESKLIENLKIELTNWSYEYVWDDMRNPEIKLDIREHRRYRFGSDFWLDFLKLDSWDEEEENKLKDIEKDYYVFNLDFFEHSSMRFDLVLDRRDIWYYEFDRSRNVWIIAVKKDIVEDEKQAIEYARDELERYNSYINWWILEYTLFEKSIYKNDKGNSIENWDFLDWEGCFFEPEDAINQAKYSVYHYLDNAGIEYDDIEIKG